MRIKWKCKEPWFPNSGSPHWSYSKRIPNHNFIEAPLIELSGYKKKKVKKKWREGDKRNLERKRERNRNKDKKTDKNKKGRKGGEEEGRKEKQAWKWRDFKRSG